MQSHSTKEYYHKLMKHNPCPATKVAIFSHTKIIHAPYSCHHKSYPVMMAVGSWTDIISLKHELLSF
jgi:hypothetical protein